MDIVLIITATLTLIAVGVFMYLYLVNEKKDKAERANDLNEIKELFKNLQDKFQEAISQQNEKLEILGKENKDSA